jgi:hypothetical protein
VVVGTGEHADRKAIVELGRADAEDKPSDDPEHGRSHRQYPGLSSVFVWQSFTSGTTPVLTRIQFRGPWPARWLASRRT